MSEVKFVVVTPGRVAYTSPQAKEKFTDKPKAVLWTPYLEELLTEHGDIEIVDPVARMAASQKPAIAEAMAKAKSMEADQRVAARIAEKVGNGNTIVAAPASSGK